MLCLPIYMWPLLLVLLFLGHLKVLENSLLWNMACGSDHVEGIWQEICFWTFWLFPLSLSPFLSSHYFSVRPWGCVQALCPSLEWDTHHGVWTLLSRSSPWPHLCLSLPPFPVNICFLLNPHSRDRGNPGAFFLIPHAFRFRTSCDLTYGEL